MTGYAPRVLSEDELYGQMTDVDLVALMRDPQTTQAKRTEACEALVRRGPSIPSG